MEGKPESERDVLEGRVDGWKLLKQGTKGGQGV